MATKIIFNRRKILNTKGEAIIEIEIKLPNVKRTYRSTGIRIIPEFWDKKNNRVSILHPDHDNLNKTLLLKKKQIDDYILTSIINNETPSILAIDNNVNSTVPTFYEYFTHVKDVTNQELSNGTKLIYNRCLKYLQEFSKDIPINAVDLMFMEKFNNYLIAVKQLKRNSRSSLIKKIKKVLNEAVKNEFMTYSQNPFNKGFNVREEEVEAQSLTLEQVRIIENLDIGLRPELEKTMDMFLFSCYTSMRFGDLVTLSYENFQVLENGQIRLSYYPAKTMRANGKRIEFIISDFWNGKIDVLVKKYFEKFEHLKTFEKKDRLFFNYSNANYNRQLKELQSFAKIKHTLYSHLARHTCITLLINDFGMDITKAQMIAGHSKIEQTRKYLRVTENDLQAAAKKIDWNI